MDGEKTAHLVKVLKAVRNVSRLIAHADTAAELCDGICDILIDSREYNNAWIILLENGMPVQPYFHAGFGSSFKEMASLLDKGFFPVCVEKALKSHSLSVITNPVKECQFCPFLNNHENSTGFSYPLIWKKKLLGWVSVSVPKEYAEDSEEQILFMEMVDDLSFALDSLKTRNKNVNLTYNYETLVNNIKDSVLVINRNGDIYFMNPAARECFNINISKYANNNISEIFPENLQKITKININNVEFTGHVSFLSVIKNKYNIEVEVEISMSMNIKAHDSNIICFIHDLTDRNKAIKSLRESEERFQMLFNNAPLGYQSLDENGCLVEVNQAWLDSLGYKRDEVIGKWFGDFLNPDFVSAFQERFPLFLKTGKIHSEFYMKKKSGEDCYISFEGRVGHNQDGSFKQTHCILHDVTDKLKAENILKEREVYFRNIFNNISTGVAIYEAVNNGEDFIIFDMNPACQKLSDVDLVNIKGKRITEVFPGVKDFGLFKVIQNVYKTGLPSYLPVSEYKDSKILLYVENRVSRLPDGKIIVLFEDYSEKRILEEEIQQIRKMESIGKLAGGIAHDLNNLLTPILGYSELLKYSNILGEKEILQIEKIYGAGVRASALVTKLLTFSRKQPSNHVSLNLNNIIKDFVDIFGKTIHENIDVKLILDNGIGKIMGDQGQIEQIIMNLCVNAQDAMPDGGEIIIKTFSVNSQVCLSVKDTGSGISESILPHIFEPFYSTKGVNGTGLGLSTVYGIVMQHKSLIDVESSLEDGTDFTITFPECLDETEEVKTDYEAESFIGSKRILLVEDDEEILELLEHVLIEKGLSIEKVSNGKRALEFLDKDSNFDLIISDVIMPELNGINLYEIVSSRYKNIKFLFISGYSNDFNVNGQSISSTDIFIQKPFTIKKISEKINEILNPGFVFK